MNTFKLNSLNNIFNTRATLYQPFSNSLPTHSIKTLQSPYQITGTAFPNLAHLHFYRWNVWLTGYIHNM